MISVEGVALVRGEALVLRGLSLRLEEGEILALVGPSGGGKTSLLRVILGLSAPTRGRVLLRGRLVSEAGRVVVPPRSRGLGVVFQDLALWPHLRVRANLAFGLSAQGVGRAERRERSAEALASVGLEGLGGRFPGELSGGERQRVAIARALVLEPDAVLLDEPLSHLDVALKEELLALLSELLRARGVAAIYVTHDPREAAALADRVVVIEEGVVAQSGTAAELAAAPATDFARVFAEGMSAQRRR